MLVLSGFAAVAAVTPRVAVFGGSGFIGSRVCQTLVDAGCDVVSLSRTGEAPAWASEERWCGRVEWRQSDLLSDRHPPLGQVDGAVSCVGNMRPSPRWESGSFFGLHWDYEAMVRENGLATDRSAAAARRAGASRFVYLSASSAHQFAYGGALMGYVDGKEAGEEAVRQRFGDAAACAVGPSLVLGGGRYAGLQQAYRALVDVPLVRPLCAAPPPLPRSPLPHSPSGR